MSEQYWLDIIGTRKAAYSRGFWSGMITGSIVVSLVILVIIARGG